MFDFWIGAAIGLFIGTLGGVVVTCIFASAKVTEAEAETSQWQRAYDDLLRQQFIEVVNCCDQD